MRIIVLISTLLMIALFVPTSTFANPYVAAYPSFGNGTVSDINQFWLW